MLLLVHLRSYARLKGIFCAALERELRLCGTLISRAVASNKPTEALFSVISFAFVVYSHHKHS